MMQEAEIAKNERLIKQRILVFLLVFPLLILLGLLMRLHQAGRINVGIGEFYTYMTLHGMGMTILIFSTVLAVLWHLLGKKFISLNPELGRDLLYADFIAFVLIAIAGLMGKFAGGWYFLYPLPFEASFWTTWSVGMTYFGLLMLMVSWLISILHMFRRIAYKYGRQLKELLRVKSIDSDIPLTIFLAILSIIPAAIILIVGAILSGIYLLVYFLPSFQPDVIVMRDMAVVTTDSLRYLSIVIIVSSLPALIYSHTHRGWQLKKYEFYSWISSILLFLIAIFGTFALSFIGKDNGLEYWRLLSLISFVPAAILTCITMLKQFLHIKNRKDIVVAAYAIGVFAWLIGIVAGIYGLKGFVHFESTLLNNAFHHTTMLGVVLILFGFFFSRLSSNIRSGWLLKIGFKILLLGFAGFLVMFYLAGIYAVPRRYSDYVIIRSDVVQNMALITAEISTLFIIISLLGVGFLYIILFRKGNKEQ